MQGKCSTRVALFLIMGSLGVGIVAGIGSTGAEDGASLFPGTWHTYADRYAIVVMGGAEAEEDTSRLYSYYWQDTYGMYGELRGRGFSASNIYFLSYGDSADAHPTDVDATSTTSNVRAAYQWAQSNCTISDLLYVFWVDHGNATGFQTHDGTLSHAALDSLMRPIEARQIIGAYNPCLSGAVIDDISRLGVVTVTSQNADSTNRWGWAGYWRRALRDDPADHVDADGDGHVSMAEAYDWIAPFSLAAGESSTYDDNGDGIGHVLGQAGYDPDDPAKDGFIGQLYSLDGWRSLLWVDFAHVGTESGYYDEPFNTLAEALNGAATDAAIVIKSGSTSETVDIDQHVTLRAWNGAVTVGESPAPR